MTTLPLVSIGMPVYNGEEYLRSALDSLLEQDYPNLEIIISDDVSTDGTSAICLEYAARDSRIIYHRGTSNMRAYRNFNYVFGQARGEFFMWAAQDDLWHPTFVSRCTDALRSNPEAVLCHSYGQPISPTGQPIGSAHIGYVNEAEDVRSRWRRMMTFWGLNEAVYGLMRREAAARTRLMRLSLCADLIFVAEMALQGHIIQVPETLFWKRRPVLLEDYRSHEEMLDYVAGSDKKRPLLVRLDVLRECLGGIKHAGLSPKLRRQLERDTLFSYFTERLWLVDIKEDVVSRLGRDRYRKWLRVKATIRGKPTTTS
jgi:glycosyltransferase involved in cell wall biosynthesis